MFLIQSIISWTILSFSLAQYLGKDHGDKEIIIEPLELVLRSTDEEGIFYCNGRVELNKQSNKLVASIEHPIVTLPAFGLKSKRINRTTVRIRIRPNGYIGINRVSCHWSNNTAYGQTADLIIGENPGVIQLKERCLAYDRRFVQCIFRAPIIARAFQNGFPRLYTFSEIHSESYRSVPTFVNFTKENEFIFQFEPRDRHVIPKKTSMAVNITLRKFNSSIYYFNIVPAHTTKVDFQIKDISSKQFVIRINHNDTGTVRQRLCSGYINQMNDQNVSIAVQDIAETTDQRIVVKHLRSSTRYDVCLRCFYERNDQSFNEEECRPVQTRTGAKIWLPGLIIGLMVGLIMFVIASVLMVRRLRSSGDKPSTRPASGSRTTASVSGSEEHDSFIDQPTAVIVGNGYCSDEDKYKQLNNLVEELANKNKISPDTIDLTRPTSAQ